MIVVDTSVLVDFFKGARTTATSRLRQIETDEIPFMIPVVCCQELLQGAKNQKEWSLLEQYLSLKAPVLEDLDPYPIR